MKSWDLKLPKCLSGVDVLPFCTNVLWLACMLYLWFEKHLPRHILFFFVPGIYSFLLLLFNPEKKRKKKNKKSWEVAINIISVLQMRTLRLDFINGSYPHKIGDALLILLIIMKVLYLFGRAILSQGRAPCL